MKYYVGWGTAGLQVSMLIHTEWVALRCGAAQLCAAPHNNAMHPVWTSLQLVVFSMHNNYWLLIIKWQRPKVSDSTVLLDAKKRNGDVRSSTLLTGLQLVDFDDVRDDVSTLRWWEYYDVLTECWTDAASTTVRRYYYSSWSSVAWIDGAASYCSPSSVQNPVTWLCTFAVLR